LIRNRSLQFRCEHIFIKTANNSSPFTHKIPPGKLLRVPIAHGEGCFFADTPTLEKLRDNGQILWQYANVQGELTETSNHNGSLWNIAGIGNEAGNVAGLMPHPERASEDVLGSADGRLIFESLIAWLENKTARVAA
jgi:phosphoribosylformylglycinamidine synthase